MPIYQRMHYKLPCTFLFAVCTVFVFMMVEDTVRNKSGVKIFTLEHFKRTARIYTQDNGTNRRWKLAILLLVVVLVNV